jgi:hypothetical protein
MAEMVASAAASAMGSFIGKLAAMLGENYQLAGKVRRGIRSLMDELSTMDAVLQELAEKDDDQIDGQTKDWRNKVRELSLDIEDCIDRFMLNRSHGGSKANCVRKAVRKVKILLQDRGLAEEIQELKSLAIEPRRLNTSSTSVLGPSSTCTLPGGGISWGWMVLAGRSWSC